MINSIVKPFIIASSISLAGPLSAHTDHHSQMPKEFLKSEAECYEISSRISRVEARIADTLSQSFTMTQHDTLNEMARNIQQRSAALDEDMRNMLNSIYETLCPHTHL